MTITSNLRLQIDLFETCASILFRRIVSTEENTSVLPDPLICHILSNLPIRDSVKTSVLSTRWRSLWLWVPSLELLIWNFRNIHAFMSFGDRFFDYNSVSCIESVKLYFDEQDADYLTPWINALVKRKIKHLYVRRIRGNDFEMPLSLYACETLVSLTLFSLMFSADFVSLPCLKKLSLKYVLFPNEVTFERLVYCCPVLEDLRIDVICKDGKVYRVHSRSLKRLRLQRFPSMMFGSVPGVVIDAPLLCDLRIDDHLSEFYIVNNLDSIAKLDIHHLYFGSKNFGKRFIRSFLPMISNVMDMTISEDILKVIHRYSIEGLPLFDNMSCLHVTLPVSELEWLPTFLECCPNLKSLFMALNGDFKEMHYEEMNQISFLLGISRIMDITISSAKNSKVFRHNSKLKPPHQCGYMSHLHITLYVSSLSKWLPIFLESCPNLKFLNLALLGRKKIHSKKMYQISFSSVPECLLYSLEFVDFDTAKLGYNVETKLVTYFLENSAVLKKLTLHVKNSSTVYKKSLLKIPRRSTNCQVILI